MGRRFAQGQILRLARSGVAVLALAALGATAEEQTAPAELLQRLAEHLSDAVKAGEKPKAWVAVFGRKSEVALQSADAKTLTVLVQSNPFPIAWTALAPAELTGIARAVAGEHGARLLTAGELALALGLHDQAAELLAQARVADPKLAEQAAALLKRVPAAPAPPEPPKEAEPKPEKTGSKPSVPSAGGLPAAKSGFAPRLAQGWWKSMQIPPVAAAKVYASHPRLFLRDNPWGEGGLTLDVLRFRATKDPWKGWIARFTDEVSSHAMKFLLTGEKSAAEKAIAALQQRTGLEGDTDDGDELEKACMAFDWLYTYPGFSDAQKKKAAEHLAAVAEEFIKRLNTGGPHIFHTRMYAWANGIVFAGIVLAGHHPKAEEFLNYGYQYWREKLFPARWHQAGVWQNGFGYGRKYLVRSTCFFLHAWKSGTGEDLWKLIKDEQDDWIGAQLRFLVYSQRPDGRYPAYGDCFNNDDEKFSGGLAQMLAAGTHAPLAVWLADALHKKHGLRTVEDHWNIYPFLFFDPALPKKGPEDLPHAEVFGPHALGFVVLRGGWGPKDAQVFYKCGDYFENHGHFDQGGFEIFRERPLAVDSGIYAGGMNSPHRLQYFRQSVASNTLLINDPADPADTGCQRILDFQNADTLDRYLAHKGVESGEILEFRSAGDHTVVVSEFAAAYAPGKVKQCTRMLVFLRGVYLVICDAVQTAKPERVRFLLHYPTDASIDKTRSVIENGPSRLICDTLWPENAKIVKVPGFMVNGKNFPPAGNADPEFAGAGRLEIEAPDALAHTSVLVNVLAIAPKEQPIERARARCSGSEVSVEIAGKKIQFMLTSKTVSVK